MNDLLTTVKDIRASVDPAALLSGSAGKTTALSDQIKFSSLMKTLVDTPQETLAAVQNDARPVEQPTGTPKYSEQRFDQGAGHQNTRDNGGKRPQIEQFDTPSQDTSTLTSKVDNSERDNPQTSGLGEQQNAGDKKPHLNTHEITKNDGLEQFSEHASIAQSQNKNPNHDGKLSGLGLPNVNLNGTFAKKPGEGIQQQTQSGLKRPNTGTTQILLDNQQGKDLKLSSSAANPTKNQRTSALANQQAQNLAGKFGRDVHAQINVSVTDAPDKQKININQAVTKNALLAAQGQNSENPLTQITSQQRAAGTTAPDRTGTNLNSSSQNNRGQNTNLANQQTAQANFIQTLHLQSLAAAKGTQTHNSVPKFASIMTDTANIMSTASPTGSSQISQTARTNPMQAQPQLSKPPVPMEQISVKIQKAIHQGADRINIKLHPAHLGRVEVRMDIGRDGQLSAIILAEKPETLDLLQKDVRGLERALQQAGLDTNSNSFNFGLKNNGAQQPSQDHKNANNSDQNLSENLDPPIDDADPDTLLQRKDQKGREQLADSLVDIKV